MPFVIGILRSCLEEVNEMPLDTGVYVDNWRDEEINIEILILFFPSLQSYLSILIQKKLFSV